MAVISLDMAKMGSSHNWVLYLVLNNFQLNENEKFEGEHFELKDFHQRAIS